MNILLLGEFSSLYKNLKEGLSELGHDVLIASDGDGWKNVQRDISLGGSGTNFSSKLYRKLSPYLKKTSFVDLMLFNISIHFVYTIHFYLIST